MKGFDESGLTPLTPQQHHMVKTTVEIDARLAELYIELWQAEEFIEEIKDEDVQMVLASAIRAAYYKGYADAAKEVPQQHEPRQYASQFYYE